MTKDNLEANLAIRINKEDLDVFKTKANDLGRTYQVVLREVVRAFNENRLQIIPTDEQKESLKIYKQ